MDEDSQRASAMKCRETLNQAVKDMKADVQWFLSKLPVAQSPLEVLLMVVSQWEGLDPSYRSASNNGIRSSHILRSVSSLQSED